MPQINSMRKARASHRSFGSARRFKTGDLLTSNTFRQDDFVPVLEVQATRTETFAGGNGVPRNQATQGYADFDFEDSGDNEVTGDGRWEVYRDSDKREIMATSDEFDISELAAAVSENRTDKVPMNHYLDSPPMDGYLVFAIAVDNSTNDGNSPSSTNSSIGIGLPYTRINQG